MSKRLLLFAALTALGLACNISAPARSTPSAFSFALSPSPSPDRVTPTISPSPAATPTPLSSPLGSKYDLLIVTPAEFLAPLRPLADWKIKTGMPTGFLTLEDVDRMCTGRDAPERIKRCLSLYQKQSGVRYAMLVGDGNKFPIRFTTFMVIEDDAATIGHVVYYPADLYYADLYKSDGSFDDWDANGNGAYGEIGGLAQPVPLNVDQVDLNPDISVGRVPVSTIAETQIYVGKVMGYESGAQGSDWARRILAIVTGNLMPDECRYEEQMLSAFPTGWDPVRLYVQGNSCRATPALTKENILQEMNRGVGLVSFLGHGNIDLWADAITVKDFADLKNSDRLPIVFSGGCTTGEFTADPPAGPYTDTLGNDHPGSDAGEVFPSTPPPPAPLQVKYNNGGIMEFSLVQIPDGVVTYIGSVTIAQMGATVNLNEYFFNGIALEEPTVGDAWNFAIRKYYPSDRFHTEPGDIGGMLWMFHQPWKYMLFGDPSLRIGGVRSSKP
jgi:hypothetical protein